MNFSGLAAAYPGMLQAQSDQDVNELNALRLLVMKQQLGAAQQLLPLQIAQAKASISGGGGRGGRGGSLSDDVYLGQAMKDAWERSTMPGATTAAMPQPQPPGTPSVPSAVPIQHQMPPQPPPGLADTGFGQIIGTPVPPPQPPPVVPQAPPGGPLPPAGTGFGDIVQASLSARGPGVPPTVPLSAGPGVAPPPQPGPATPPIAPELAAIYASLKAQGAPASAYAKAAKALGKAKGSGGFGKAPSGFRFTPEGTLEPIPGGPQSKQFQEARGSVLNDETLDQMADQARAGDTSVFTNLGRGVQGAINVVHLRERIAQKDLEEGVSGAERASRIAEFGGTKAEQVAVGRRQGLLELAGQAFTQIVPIVRQASQAVDRTQYPLLNEVILAGEKHTGDPNVVALGGAINSAINIYTRAVSPTGTPTVADKRWARDVLEAAWSTGQVDAALDMMTREVTVERAVPAVVRATIRKRFIDDLQKGGGAAPETTPTRAASQTITREQAIEELRRRGAM